MRGGCTIPPWPRFPRPPDNPGRPNFSRSGLEPWPILHGPSQTPRGLSAASSAFPKNRSGRLPASFCERDFSRGRFRDCSYFLMFRPPSLLASRIAPTAVSFPTGQLRRLYPSRTCVVAFARIGYAIGRLQAIDRTGTLTPLDSQFCRLPPIPIARSLTHDDSTVLTSLTYQNPPGKWSVLD